MSLRAKLTSAYAAAILLTTGVFAGALWMGRGTSVYLELQRGALAQADAALRMIRVVESRDSITIVGDPLFGPQLTPRLTETLEVVPDFLWVIDTTGRLLYQSRAARQLSPGQVEVVLRAVPQLRRANVSAVVAVGGSELLIAAVRPEGDPPSAIGAVVAGAPTTATVLAGRELLGAMLVVAPLILLLSIGVAYAIAATAFEPVGRIINEVEAITDGRSLHRRLPVYEGGDELGRLVATLNAMIARLENSFGALRRFTADASHELKTPLTVLRADVERAMSATTPAAERLVALEEALQETARMSDLVNSLLTLARADEGRFDLHREPVQLSSLVADVFETAVILGESAGLTVTLAADEGGVVDADVTRLRQLLLNLVTNAIKYTPRGGRIELSLRAAGDVAVFAVRDTGIGIAAADLPHVFERFWRADRARSRGGERSGFGLGLAISQYLAQAHGGMLSVQSRLGRGSTFTVTLPLAPAATPADAASPGAPVPAPSTTERAPL